MEVVTNNHKNAKLVSILAYFLIGVIWYFVDPSLKNEKLTKFHVKQSLNLAILSILSGVVISAITPILIFIPIVGWLALIILSMVVPIFFLILFIMGIISAVNEKMTPIPIVGFLANKYLTF